MADGADDGGGARGDRAAQRLVGERQQVLDAAAPAGDDDHVNRGVAVQLAQRVDDLGDRIWALHDCVAHLESHRGPATGGDGHHVTLGGRGAAGDQPDSAGQERERPLEPRIEQPFGVQQLAQPLDAGEQLADADRANLADCAAKMSLARCGNTACRSTTTWVPSVSVTGALRTSSRGHVIDSDMSAAGSRNTMNTVLESCRALISVNWPSTQTVPSRSIHLATRVATARTGHGFSGDWPCSDAVTWRSRG